VHQPRTVDVVTDDSRDNPIRACSVFLSVQDAGMAAAAAVLTAVACCSAHYQQPLQRRQMWSICGGDFEKGESLLRKKKLCLRSYTCKL
jgi:hypothetical protein